MWEYNIHPQVLTKTGREREGSRIYTNNRSQWSDDDERQRARERANPLISLLTSRVYTHSPLSRSLSLYIYVYIICPLWQDDSRTHEIYFVFFALISYIVHALIFYSFIFFYIKRISRDAIDDSRAHTHTHTRMRICACCSRECVSRTSPGERHSHFSKISPLRDPNRSPDILYIAVPLNYIFIFFFLKIKNKFFF